MHNESLTMDNLFDRNVDSLPQKIRQIILDRSFSIHRIKLIFTRERETEENKS